MKSMLLFPNHYKKLGWLLFVPGLVIGLLALNSGEHFLGLRMTVPSVYADNFSGPSGFFQMVTTEITCTLSGILLIIGGLLIAFSKEKHEDEFVAQLRLESFQWAVLVNYTLLLLAFLTVYGVSFLMVLPLNMFTVILLFIVRFEYTLYKNRKWATDEKHA